MWCWLIHLPHKEVGKLLGASGMASPYEFWHELLHPPSLAWLGLVMLRFALLCFALLCFALLCLIAFACLCFACCFQLELYHTKQIKICLLFRWLYKQELKALRCEIALLVQR